MTSELIGEGSFGCVISPPITDNIIKVYKIYEDISNHDVGKLFKTRNHYSFKIEYKHYTMNQKLIKNYDKITVPIKGCNIISYINDYNTKKCLDLSRSNDNYIAQIIYKNAGICFNEIPINSIKFEKFIEMLLKFMINFKTYVDGQYIHGDLNSGNIMINFNTWEILLIDFFFQQTHHTFYPANTKSTFKHRYVFYPPEYKLIYIHKYDKSSHDDQINQFIENHKKNINLYSKETIKRNIYKLCKNFDINNVDLYKIDIYGIGINLHLIRQSIIFNNITDEHQFNKLIKGMICFDPVKRYDINKIIKFLQNIY